MRGSDVSGAASATCTRKGLCDASTTTELRAGHRLPIRGEIAGGGEALGSGPGTRFRRTTWPAQPKLDEMVRAAPRLPNATLVHVQQALRLRYLRITKEVVDLMVGCDEEAKLGAALDQLVSKLLLGRGPAAARKRAGRAPPPLRLVGAGAAGGPAG